MDLPVPIGPAALPRAPLMPVECTALLDQLAALPGSCRRGAQLNPARLAQASRPSRWTGQQLVHHAADTYLQCSLRAHLALTENQPNVPGFDQEAWPNLPDAVATPVVGPAAGARGRLHARGVGWRHYLTGGQRPRRFFLPVTSGSPRWSGRWRATPGPAGTT